MSAEIPGSRLEFQAAGSATTDLVEKIMLATGHEPTPIMSINCSQIGGYAGEIILTALSKAGLLSPDFTVEALAEAITDLDNAMNLDGLVAAAIIQASNT